MAPKMNVRQGPGGGAGMGYRGGKGKPGYPVPDNLKHNIGVVDEIVEDLIGKIATTGFVDKADDMGMQDSESSAFDIVKKNENDYVNEGGVALKTDRVNREDVAPTLEVFKKQVLSKIKHKSANPIGSTGKKSSSGDLDVAFDTDTSFDDVVAKLNAMKLNNKPNKGLGVISVEFPQYTAEGKKNGKNAQVDMMMGPREWIEFSYYAPSEGESSYGGLHARGLFIAMMNGATGHRVSPARGFFKVDADEKNKTYIQDPKKAVELINANSKQSWTVDDLNKPFEKIWEKCLKSFDKAQLKAIRDYFVEFMKRNKKDVPKELGENVWDSQDLKLLTGVENVLSANIQKLKNRGLTLKSEKQVGSGSRGIAYELTDGRILKITSDKSEAVASNSIKGKNLKHIVKIDDVFNFKDSEHYGIVQEKLIKLSDQVASSINKALMHSNFFEAADALKKNGKFSWQQVYEKMLELERERSEDNTKHIDFLKSFKINEMVDEVFKQGITFADYHAGNIMRRTDGTYVIIDLGYSKMQGDGGNIGVLEKKSVNEAEKKKGMPKGIQHLEDMNPHDFMTFISKYKDLSLEGGLEVSEKVDGSAAITFGVENGKVWTQSKKGQRYTSSSQYGDKPMFRALRMAHQALESKAKDIISSWPSDVDFMVGEVLYTKIPNTIEYGPNVLMIHGVQKKDGSTIQEQEARKLAETVTKSAGGKLHDGKEEWKFEYKRIIASEEVLVDVKNEYENLSQIYDRLKQLEADKLKKDGKAAYKAAADSFKSIQAAVKKKLLTQLRKQKSIYGPEGGAVEGIVFRDLESGDMTKLVDKEYFTKLNEFLWSFRNLLDRGVKVGDKMELGVFSQFIKNVAQNVIGSNDIATTMFVKKLKKMAEQTEFPPEADTAEKKADFVLSKYIADNKLMSGDYLNVFQKELDSAAKSFEKVNNDWQKNKKKELKYDIKDDEGNVVKSVKMDDLIKQRTDSSFEQMSELIKSLQAGVQKIQGMNGELTKKTALLKLAMGQNRFDKLAGAAEDEDQVAESAEPTTQKTIKRPEEVVKYFRDKLLKRGYDVTSQVLGQGSRGTVFALADGKAIKITDDTRESEAALKIKTTGSEFKHFAKIYDVFKFPLPALRSFGIVQEKLLQLDRDFERQLRAALTSFRDVLAFPRGQKFSWEFSKEQFTNKWIDVNGKDFVEKNLKFMEDNNIDKIIDELKNLGIAFNDYHSGNFLRRKDGTLVLIDIGYSKVDNADEIPVIESKNMKDDYRDFDQTDPRAVLKSFSKKLLKRGLNVKDAKELGSGYNGTAFKVGDRALKITGDISEAKSANHIKSVLKNKKLKHVIYIHDVFAFPGPPTNSWYGIVEDLAQPFNEKDKFQDCIVFIAGKLNLGGSHIKNPWIQDWQFLKNRIIENCFGDSEDITYTNEVFSFLENLKFHELLKELKDNKIEYEDVHGDNFMMKNNNLVLVDLGGNSKSPGNLPDIIEGLILRQLNESRVDKIGLTIGRFHPFTKGHAAMVRTLCKRFDRVVVLIAGNNTAKPENPFSFELRKEMMKESLPDVFSKLEVYKSDTAFLPSILSKLAVDTKSAVEGDTAVTILVGQDRVADMTKQLQSAAASGKSGEHFYDVTLATVEELPPVKNEGEDERISGTRFREALSKDDKESVKKMCDSHLVSNNSKFEEIYAKLKKELDGNQKVTAPAKVKKLTKKVDELVESVVLEALGATADQRDIEDAIEANVESLKKIGVDGSNPKYLGKGKDGVAYQVASDKVLKVTTNMKEAASSLKVQKSAEEKNLENVVKIFSVFKFRPETTDGKELYGIVSEMLTKLTKAEQEEFHSVAGFWLDPDLQSKTLKFVKEGDYEGLLSAIESIIDEYEKSGNPIDISEAADEVTAPAKKSAFGKTPGVKQTTSALSTETQPTNSTKEKMAIVDRKFKKFNLPSMFNDLKSIGIKFSDYHGENLMKRGDTFVINDLGRSEGGLRNIPQLENNDILGKITESIMNEFAAFTGMGDSMLGARAGSSAISSFKNRVDPNSEELWQNQLSNLQIGFSHPEVVYEELTEKSIKDKASDMFEREVAFKINQRNGPIKAEKMADVKMPDIKLTLGKNTEYVEVKMTTAPDDSSPSSVQMGSPRISVVNGQFVTAKSPMAQAVVDAMNSKLTKSTKPVVSGEPETKKVSSKMKVNLLRSRDEEEMKKIKNNLPPAFSENVIAQIGDETKKFMDELNAFVIEKQKKDQAQQTDEDSNIDISLISTRAPRKNTNDKYKNFVNKQTLKEFLESRGSNNMFVMKNVDLTGLVARHYLLGKNVVTRFIQIQDDFFVFPGESASSIPVESGIPTFKMSGTITVRIAFSASKDAYEIMITPKPPDKPQHTSEFSLTDPAKKFPFIESK